MQFFETRGGHEFLYGTMPALAKNIKEQTSATKELTEAVKMLCNNTVMKYPENISEDTFSARLKELINGVINHISVAESVSEQIEFLRACGFENSDLEYFGYSESDILDSESEIKDEEV